MRRVSTLAVVAAISLAVVAPLSAQELELPEYSAEQRWQRLAYLTVGWQAAVVAFGEAHGMTPQEVGSWVGEYFSTSWVGGVEASQLVFGWNRNHMAWPEASVEVTASTPTSVTAQFNRPIEAFFGPGRRTMGVAGDDILTMLRAIDDAIAEWVGVDMARSVENEHDVLTFETQYGPIRASGDLRWARGSYLSWLNWLQLLSIRMSNGMSAAEIGAADAELFAPSWSADTPWRLFRGMTWNEMTDPDAECDVLSATPDRVEARCQQHYRAVVEQNRSRFNVTPQDVFDASRAFSEGVAEHLGLRWSETLVDGMRMITVTRR